MTLLQNAAGMVLVIDDDEVSLRLLKVNLERSGYGVIPARTAQEGVEAARASSPDLVLSDALLPDSNGLQVCNQLVEDSRTRHIPVIIMSSQSGSKDIIATLEAGADDYLVKPLDFQEVIARVRAHIRRAQLKPALNPLTGLPGNLIIEAEIRRLTSPGHGLFAVLYTDLNHFKAYNDVYGFPDRRRLRNGQPVRFRGPRGRRRLCGHHPPGPLRRYRPAPDCRLRPAGPRA